MRFTITATLKAARGRVSHPLHQFRIRAPRHTSFEPHPANIVPTQAKGTESPDRNILHCSFHVFRGFTFVTAASDPVIDRSEECQAEVFFDSRQFSHKLGV